MRYNMQSLDGGGSDAGPVVLDPPPVVSFGPFRLDPLQRLLLEGDKPVRLGSRALDILIALTERPGELVGKEELMARVWPNTFVDIANLTVHISALRRALSDGRAGNRYLINIPGRGYRFVAPVTLVRDPVSRATPALSTTQQHNLPVCLTRLIGRADIVGTLAAQLAVNRLLTIVGPGGMGKTSVALAVAEELIANYRHGIWLIDLAPLGDPRLVPSALASALGLEIRSENPLSAVIAMLREKQMLLVLDSCEHVIEAAAALAVGVLRGAPGVRVLATSREPLRVEGEHVHRLCALQTPPATRTFSAAEALNFPAVELFVERAAATMNEFELTDAEAGIVGDICRQLDGIPLAIEFAAARIDGHGVQGLADRLDDRMRLLTSGRRSALPRHHTMSAALDWSHGLLTAAERKVLRRVAIFAGGFTLRAAGTVTADATHPDREIFENVTALVAKSLISADFTAAEPRLRLLETTRAYALAKLAESGETEMLGRRHAEYYRDLLESADHEAASEARGASFATEIDNIRASLAWAFAPGGDESIGVALAAAAAPMWLEMSLLTECQRWSEKAVGKLDTVAGEARREMVLQAAFGISLIFTRGMTDEAHLALTRAAGLAENLGDTDYQLRILHGLWLFEFRVADFESSLAIARRFAAVAAGACDPVAAATADRMLGTSLHVLGDQSGAKIHLVRALAPHSSASQRAHIVRFDVDQRAFALSVLANVLWLQGFPDQAVHTGQLCIEEATASGHPVSLCLALKWGGGAVSLRTGDLTAAERSIEDLIDHAQEFSLDTDYACGLGLQGQLSAKRGDVVNAVRLLRAALDGMREVRFHVLYSEFLTDLANVLAMAGDITEGLATVEEALGRAERIGEAWLVPEILRLKAQILLVQDRSHAAEAENCLLRSLDLAREQQALSWELRSATSLVLLRRDQGHVGEARDRLMSVYGRFTEGFGTADLVVAKRILDDTIPWSPALS
jgi:predicted ATPase/DNA-binding winged helix-turn-helix (wHTH) protein